MGCNSPWYTDHFAATKEKVNVWPPPDLICLLYWGGSSTASPLKIWDVIAPYLGTLFEHKTKN